MKRDPEMYLVDTSPAEEAAMLFAAGFADAAMDQLVESLRREATAGDRRPWLMLLDLYRITARRSAFELIAARYARMFAAAPPQWPSPSPSGPADTVVLEGELSRAADMQALQKAAMARKIVVVDMRRVERLHYTFAAEFVAALRGMKAAGRRVILTHVAEIHATLLETFGALECAVLMRHKPAAAIPELMAA